MYYTCVTQKEMCKDVCLSVDHAVVTSVHAVEQQTVITLQRSLNLQQLGQIELSTHQIKVDLMDCASNTFAAKLLCMVLQISVFWVYKYSAVNWCVVLCVLLVTADVCMHTVKCKNYWFFEALWWNYIIQTTACCDKKKLTVKISLLV